jgi:hypothetical protein
MPHSKLIAPVAALLLVCALGSALTRHTHGAANILSNIFFFTLALLLLLSAAAAITAAITRGRARRRPRTLKT